MSTERDERLARIYERGDQLRRRRAGSLLSGGVACAVVTLLAIASSTIGGDIGAAELATIGGAQGSDDGARGTPRGDEADERDGNSRSDKPRRQDDREESATGAADEQLAAGPGSDSGASVDGGDGTTSTTEAADDAVSSKVPAQSTSTTVDPCRNSTDPDCGPFHYDPPLPPDQPAEITIVASPASPRVGEPVTFTVTVVDPDGSSPGCQTFDPDAKDIEPPGDDGGEGLPTQSTCGGARAQSVTLARYGPWDPPEPTPSRHEVTFTATYSVPGQRTAVYETTQVDRCEADAPCPTRSKELVLTVQP